MWYSPLLSATALTVPRSDVHIKINGKFEGDWYVSDAIAEVCRQSIGRLQYSNDGSSLPTLKPKFYDEGRATSQAVLTDENSDLVSCRLAGFESVLNTFNITYPLSGYFLYTGHTDPVDFTSALFWASGGSYLMTDLSSDSTSRYGAKTLRDDFYSLLGSPDEEIFVSNNQNALKIATQLARRFGYPSIYAVLDVQFANFATLKVLDVVEILHPGLPSWFGTSTQAMFPTYNGTETDLTRGRPWKRAKRYRAQIESLEIITAESSTPKLRIGVRLVTGPKDHT